MAKQTEHGITWTDETWNPIRGCTRVSQGCVNCYAERVANRFNKPGLAYEGLTDHNGRWNGVIRVVEDHMLDPLKWKEPRRIFVNSMSDLFHENLPEDLLTIDRIFAVMALCPQHTFQILTKRPKRMLEYLADSKPLADHRVPDHFGQLLRQRKLGSAVWPGWPLPNVWLGVSVEDQKTAEERIPLLLQTPAAVRWISAEPLLGPIDLKFYLGRQPVFTPMEGISPTLGGSAFEGWMNGLDWVVVGGESGPGARPMEEKWVRSLRDQCTTLRILSGIAFHFKQWGEWLPAMCDGASIDGHAHINCSDDPVRVGKKVAGRELDGRTWDEYPETRS